MKHNTVAAIIPLQTSSDIQIHI